MSEVKLVARTLDVFELFAREMRPLSLTELAEGLAAPASSTLALVRTLVAKGYLYETRRRGGYYPTKRLAGVSRRIDQSDSIENLLEPHLHALRDATGETVVLGKREGFQLLYLDVIESAQPIRYTAEVGSARFLHANSLGKAVLSLLGDDALQDLLKRIDWVALTEDTKANEQSLREDLDIIRSRGWSENIRESIPDLAAVAKAFPLAGAEYAISVVGPVDRMLARWDEHAQALVKSVDSVQDMLRRHGA